MRNFIKTNKHYFTIIIIGIFISIPLFQMEALNGNDSVFHLFRNHSTTVALQENQFIPLIHPYMMNGFGYAPNLFYGVLSTYIVSLIHLVTPTFGLANNLFIMLTILFSGIFMYQFVFEVSKNKFISLLASIIYMICPYHLLDIFIRGAQGEILAFVFIPLVFHGIYNILNNDRGKWYLLVIGASGLVLSHSISAFITAIFAIIYLLFYWKTLWKKETLLCFLKSGIFILLISSITILPLLEAKFSSNYMVFDRNYMRTTSQHMQKRAINLFQWGSGTTIILNISCILIIIGITIYLLTTRKSKDKKTYQPFFVMTIISLFLVFNFIPWNLLPESLSIIQFPWRFLHLSSFFFSLIIAYCISKKVKKDLIKKVIIIVLTVFTLITGVTLNIFCNDTIKDEILTHNEIKKRKDIARSTGTASAEYLPKRAIYNYSYLKKRGNGIVDLKDKDNSIVKRYNKSGMNLSFHINVNKDTIIELPYIYYPGYHVSRDDKKVETFETKNGFVGIKLNSGKSKIKATYQGTFFIKIAYTISIVSTVGLVTVILLERKNKNMKP